MVSIVIGVTDDEGAEQKHSTWALGDTPALALAGWKRKNRTMAPRIVQTSVVTDGNPVKHQVDRVREGRPAHRLIQGEKQ